MGKGICMIRKSAVDKRMFRNGELTCFSVRTKLKCTGYLSFSLGYAEAVA